MAVVRVRILVEAGNRPALHALVAAAYPGGEWRYPDYCYIDVQDAGPVHAFFMPAGSSLGGALSRLRAAVRRGARGLIVSSRSPQAAVSVAGRLPGIAWQWSVSGPGSDRMNLRLFGVVS